MLEDVQTSDEVLQNITELFHDDAEVALLYFSGHGYVNTTGAEIVTPNEVAHSGMYYKGVQMKDIMEVVHGSKVKNKIIILDCCHSGQIGKFNPTGTGSVLDEGVSILTACREDESACEAGGHGLFTELLCSALQGGAADFNGNITMGSIYAYIDRSFGEWEQRPVFKTNVSAFVSLKKVEPKVPLSVFRELPNLFSTADEVHKLDSGLLIYLFLADFLVEIFLHHAEGMRVAVGERIAENVPVFIYIYEVASPGIDTDAFDVDTALRHEFQT